MRTTGICIWLLLNMMIMGMMGYMYLLWIQYWRYARNSVITQGIYQDDNKLFHFEEEVGIQIRKGRPRIRPKNDPVDESAFIFPLYDSVVEAKESHQTTASTPVTTTATLSPEEEKNMIEKHKTLLTVHFRSSQMNGGNILLKHDNRYGVKYHGKKEKGTPKRQNILCTLQKLQVRSLRDGDEPFTVEGMAKYFPHKDVLEGQHFNSCAIVSSAGSLAGSSLGQFIDSHDAVIRFNHAPIKGYEKDVGSKTTLRILNSQILTKSKFDFWGSPLYRNVSLLIWDPSNYSSSLAEWYSSPDFPVFPEYFRRRLMIPHESLHLLHPKSLWRIWDVLQRFTYTRVLPNPPSSGFLGLVLMLHHCNIVNIIEYIPSIRYSKQCHYWEPSKDLGCIYGGWHPLSTEKLLTMVLNIADDIVTYVKGYATVPGYNQIKCPANSAE